MARPRSQTIEERPEVRASAQYLRVAPRKARLVVEHIRGRPVPEARTVLAFTPRAAAAVANAEANHGLIGDDLIVSAAYVDEGPVIKRWRARARGRVARIQKKTCHVTIRLAPAVVDGAAARRPRTTEDTAVEPEAQPTEEPKAEAKPKRATRAKKPATPKADATEKPKAKPKRAPRKKKEESED